MQQPDTSYVEAHSLNAKEDNDTTARTTDEQQPLTADQEGRAWTPHWVPRGTDIVKSFQGIKDSFPNVFHFRTKNKTKTENCPMDVKYQKLQYNEESEESDIEEASATMAGKKDVSEDEGTSDGNTPLAKMASETTYSIKVEVEKYQSGHRSCELEDCVIDEVSPAVPTIQDVLTQNVDDGQLFSIQSDHTPTKTDVPHEQNLQLFSLEKLAKGNFQFYVKSNFVSFLIMLVEIDTLQCVHLFYGIVFFR